MAVFKASLICQTIATFVLIQQSMMCNPVPSDSKFKSRPERSAALRHSYIEAGVPYYGEEVDPGTEVAVDPYDTAYLRRPRKPQHRFYREDRLMAPQIQFKIPDFELRTDGVDDDKENEIRDGLVERDLSKNNFDALKSDSWIASEEQPTANSLEKESRKIAMETPGNENPYNGERETVFVDEENIFQSAN